ncbi:MAG: Bro-N domain-containing protein [Flavobacterium sp.]|jgi:prophage antirepressor-like protein
MSNSIVPFQFDTNEIRVIVIDGEPWFVAKDICNVLEISDVSNACKRLKDYEKATHTVSTRGGNQDMAIISESGLYRLVLTSRKPQAEPFQDWVVQVVLKQIRKTGSYSVHSQTQTTQPQLPSRQLALETAKAVAEIQNLISDNNPRLAQFLIDHAISDLMPASNSLTGSKLKGVVEIAESLGLPVNGNNRTSLGKFVKKSCNHLSQQEERLVNGQQRFVACYPEDNPEVIDAVKAFFNQLV